MSTNSGSNDKELDVAMIARRAVVAIAAGAGLIAILGDKPVLTVAWRAGVIAVVGLVAIHVVERATRRQRRAPARRGAR